MYMYTYSDKCMGGGLCVWTVLSDQLASPGGPPRPLDPRPGIGPESRRWGQLGQRGDVRMYIYMCVLHTVLWV